MTACNYSDPCFSWHGYDATAGRVVNSLVKDAMTPNFLLQIARGTALDLGAGGLTDAKYLRDAGFARVVAVDHREGFGAEHVPGIECVCESLETYQPSAETFDFIICLNVLMYVPKRINEKLVRKAYSALRSGGLFVFNFMGSLDAWAGKPGITTYNAFEIDELCQRYKGKMGKTEDMLRNDNHSLGAGKPTHVYQLAVRKP